MPAFTKRRATTTILLLWRACWLLCMGVCVPQAVLALDALADCTQRPSVPLLRVAPQVWRVAAARGEANQANAGLTTQLVLVRDGPRTWLVGSGPSPDFGQALSCTLQRQWGHTVTDVVNTRAAPELAMGNNAFSSARIWALPDVMAAMQTRCPQCQDKLKARMGDAGKSLTPQSIRVPETRVGAPGAKRGVLGPFRWLALPRAAGENVLVLRHQKARIVIAQGLLWAGDVPNLQDTRSTLMLQSWRAVLAFAGGARLLGEQGDVAGSAALAEHIAYVSGLRDIALPHLVSGDLDGAAGLGLDLPAFAHRPGYARQHPLNAQHVWRELEPEIFR
jgi:hypothetical protein